MPHYRITPLDKKSIDVIVELYRFDPNTKETQWMNVTESYRWGRAFIAEDMDLNLPYKESNEAYCKMDQGENESCEFDDLISLQFDFDESISEKEQAEIKELCANGALSWIYDGDHEWEVEDDYVIVYGPYTVELCDPDGQVIKEVELANRPDPNTSWPFSQSFPKEE